MARSTSALPTRKVAAGGAAGALSIIIVWAARQFGYTEIPAEVASAFTTLLAFLVSYITPSAAGEMVDDSTRPVPNA